tara:strand:- start:42 stop:872 length:831 start_codon:yes stop_codon:yes gene_type:complete
MEFKSSNKIIKDINDLKRKHNYNHCKIKDLRALPNFDGIAEFKFKNFSFNMLNIAKDDGVVLKYLWRDKYENKSLNLWYEITRDDGFCIDVGAHTGIYSIIGGLNKKLPLMVSIEPHFLNYGRLLDNLKINSLSANYCYLAAASNQNGTIKLDASINTYHTSAGKISEKGAMSVNAIMIDNINFNKKVVAMKIDTEGHEYNVLEGAKKTIQTNKPDILFEINKESFNLCINLLKKYGYNFYYINEENEKTSLVNEFDESLVRDEGSNCLATLKNFI